jgi:transcriptional regulator with XRE-family HTH domain
MTDIRQLLAANIKCYRNALGLSQSKLADRVDTATNYIAAIEAGRRFPSVAMLEKIAFALGIDSPELFSMQTIQIDTVKKELQEHIWLDIGETLSTHISAYISKKVKDLQQT